ncbi:YncE family protein [Methanocella sp. MCL-LM]|uniref:YncE family protein n=1 Tax=Methanocella sp. MCL-LM TaxID=3412035 RepID=UPI003C7912EC
MVTIKNVAVTSFITLVILVMVSTASAFATSAYVGEMDKNIVEKFDITTNSLSGNIAVTQPSNMILSPNGDKIYVLSEYGTANTKINVYSVASEKLITSLTFGSTTNTGYSTMRISADGNTLYVVAERTVYKISTTSMTISSSTTIGTAGEVLGCADISSNGFYLYIPGTNHVYIYNLGMNQVDATIVTPLTPTYVYYDKNRNYIYASTNTAGNSVYVIDPTSQTVTRAITLGSGNNPLDITMTPDGNYIVVACKDSNKIAWIDATSYNWTANTTVNAPQKLLYSSNTNKIYAVSTTVNAISVIDPNGKTVSSTIYTTGQPGCIIVPKLSDETVNVYAAHNVKYTVTSYLKNYEAVDAVVYDENHKYISSGKTDGYGVVVFQLYSNKFYEIDFNGSGVNKTMKHYPIMNGYTVFVEPWSGWNPGRPGIDDSGTAIKTWMTKSTSGGDGIVTVYYQDEHDSTISVKFEVLRHFNQTSNLVTDSYTTNVINSGSVNHTFSIPNAVGHDYIIRVTAESSRYEKPIVRSQTLDFPNARYGVPGLPDVVYPWLGFGIALFIGCAVSLRNLKAGAVVFCGCCWVFWGAGWMTALGVGYTLILSIASVFAVLYVIGLKEEGK